MSEQFLPLKKQKTVKQQYIFMGLQDKTLFVFCCVLPKTDIPDSYSNYRSNIPVCGEAGCSSSLRCLLEISLEGLVGLQGSLGGKGDERFSVKAFLAVATLCSLLFAVLLGVTGTLGLCLVIDFGDSKLEGNFLDLDLKEAAVGDLVLNTFDD